MNNWLRRHLACGLLLFAAAGLTGCSGGAPALAGREIGTELSAEAESTEISAELLTSPAEIQVYVCGYVKNPGVYAMDPEARVQAAVEAAGGFAPGADPESMNLAERMTDGQQIRIASRKEREAAVLQQEAEDDGLVNLNTASREELMTLNGIGEAKADAIISWREHEGPFAAIEDVMRVSGIKEAAFQKIRDKIKV